MNIKKVAEFTLGCATGVLAGYSIGHNTPEELSQRERSLSWRAEAIEINEEIALRQRWALSKAEPIVFAATLTNAPLSKELFHISRSMPEDWMDLSAATSKHSRDFFRNLQ